MPKTNAETMTVRLPTQVAKELIKLRDDKNLPTIGSALQIYIQKMINDNIDQRFDKIERNIGQLAYLLEKETKALSKHDMEIGIKVGSKIFEEENIYGRFIEGLSPEERKELVEEAVTGNPNWNTKWASKLKKFAEPIFLEACKKRLKK